METLALQAGQDFEYVCGLYDSMPELASLITRRTTDRLDLSNGVTVEVGTASFRTQRGFTSPLVILDEAAYYMDAATSANPDTEIVRGVRPALSTLPGSLLLVLSSPYRRAGEVYAMHEKFWGRDDSEILVWRASTAEMNPTVDPAIISAAYTLDPDAASSDYGAFFRSDLADLFPRAILTACTVVGRRELLPQTGICYSAFCDPSGGSNDSMTLGIAYKDERGRAILSLLREWPAPFDPAVVVGEIAATLRRYGLSSLTGDKYAAQWVVSAFAQHGIVYQHAERDKSALLLELLPLVNSQSVELLDHDRLLSQLGSLQRRTGRSGKDSIDHPQRFKAHDDLAVACAGALVGAVSSTGKVSLDQIFRGCEKNSGLPEESRVHCVLHGGGYRPSDSVCRKSCKGWQAVQPQWENYRQSGGTQPLQVFVRSRFTSQTLERNQWSEVIRLGEDMLGL